MRFAVGFFLILIALLILVELFHPKESHAAYQPLNYELAASAITTNSIVGGL